MRSPYCSAHGGAGSRPAKGRLELVPDAIRAPQFFYGDAPLRWSPPVSQSGFPAAMVQRGVVTRDGAINGSSTQRRENKSQDRASGIFPGGNRRDCKGIIRAVRRQHLIPRRDFLPGMAVNLFAFRFTASGPILPHSFRNGLSIRGAHLLSASPFPRGGRGERIQARREALWLSAAALRQAAAQYLNGVI